MLSAIREGNKVFFGLVIAQAQNIEIEGDTLAVTFAPSHRGLRPQLESKRAWIEQIAQMATGRKLKLVARDAPAAPVAESAAAARAGARKDDLRVRAQAEPTVQAVLDVFGGEIEDVEETS